MSMEAIERVPVADWLLGLAVLACGIAAIVAVWRYCDQLGGVGWVAEEGPDEGGGRGDRTEPLALPPGPSDGVPVPDQIDEELWNIIDAAERRRPEVSTPEPERIAARAVGTPTADLTLPGPGPHSGHRHRRLREDRRTVGPVVFPRTGQQQPDHAAPRKRRSWSTRATHET